MEIVLLRSTKIVTPTSVKVLYGSKYNLKMIRPLTQQKPKCCHWERHMAAVVLSEMNAKIISAPTPV
ncbi:MAG: hypothetical protein ACE5NG_07900, partial [bacterium]